MKKIMVGVLALLVVATVAGADEYVNGYTRPNGTYVQGHMRSSANSSTYDNYSTQGNTNPYTGDKGYTEPSNTFSGRSNYGSSYGSSRRTR